MHLIVFTGGKSVYQVLTCTEKVQVFGFQDRAVRRPVKCM